MKRYVIGIGSIDTKGDGEHIARAVEAIGRSVMAKENFNIEILMVVSAEEFSEAGYRIVKDSISAIQSMACGVHAIIVSKTVEPEVLMAVSGADYVTVENGLNVMTFVELSVAKGEFKGFSEFLGNESELTISGDEFIDLARDQLANCGQNMTSIPGTVPFYERKIANNPEVCFFNPTGQMIVATSGKASNDADAVDLESLKSITEELMAKL